MQLKDCSPGMLLANFLLQKEQTNHLVLITGARGSGKTSWCMELSRQARLLGVSAVGVISPAVFQNNYKTSIDLLDIASGERRCLARRRNADSAREPLALQTDHWSFNLEVFSWGNHILEQIRESELLILDELGPLELLDQKGLTAGIRAIEARGYHLGCVVVRPSLLPAARERWPWSKVIYIQEKG